MQRLPAKALHVRAKTHIELRLPIGMPGLAAFTGLAALLALTSCFQLTPPKDCQILCQPGGDCPAGLTCQQPPPGMSYGFCATPGAAMCPPLFSDAGASGMEDGGSDADAGEPLPPSMLCHNGACFSLPDALRANLVLLLWPSNLPPVGSSVSVWPDQSGQGNDARAIYPSAPPVVVADGVHLDGTQLGSGFVVPDSASLDFGSGDFTLVVVADLSSSTTQLWFARKSDGARTNSRQVGIQWMLSSALTGRPQGAVDDTLVSANTDVAQPSTAVYALSRSAEHVELHVNGAVLGSADLPSSDISTTNSEDLYLGVGGITGSPVDSLETVIAIRGSVGSTELVQFEAFLRSAFATPAP